MKQLRIKEDKMVIETERLIPREYTLDDFDALYEIMSDPETMQHYPAPFDEEKTRKWITWNLDNYEVYQCGFLFNSDSKWYEKGKGIS